MVETCAAVQAADMLTAPVEKFSMAGTRPKACRPKMRQKAADGIGQQHADDSSGLA